MTSDLSAVARLVTERMGLRFSEDRWADFVRGIAAAAHALGFRSTQAFVDHLTQGCFGPREIQALAAHLTVNESYFFRSQEAFSLLETRILPELIVAHKDTDRKLRIWSAGCASGQEPYSLAILLTRLIPDRRDWEITLLATDINSEALAAAEAAEYTQWSFREAPSWLMAGYFTPVSHGRYRLSQAIREMVTFRYLNLAEDTYPSLANGIHDFDLILCRNVLMYFTRETLQKVAHRLQLSLRERGFLLLSPTEASHDLHPNLKQQVYRSEIIFRKVSDPAPSAEKENAPSRLRSLENLPSRSKSQEQHAHLSRSSASLVARLKQPAAPAVSPQRAASAQADTADRRRQHRSVDHKRRRVASPDPRETAQEARACADRGDLERALALCQAALERDKLNPSLYYLKASVLQELGRTEEAEQALQSTLFLDSSFTPARIMLGIIAQGSCRTSEAAKHFRAALAQLEQMPSDEVVPETGGLTARQMAETLASLMEGEQAS